LAIAEMFGVKRATLYGYLDRPGTSIVSA